MDDINENQPNNPSDFEGVENYSDDEQIGNDKAFYAMPLVDLYGKEEEKSTAPELPKIEEEEPIPEEILPSIAITDEIKAKKAKRREKQKEERRKKEEEKENLKRHLKVTIIVFAVLLFIMWLAFYALTNMMPTHLMEKGKEYLNAGEYQKALKMFKMASDAKPYDDEPVYLQAVTLSKMPLTYDVQKELYEISQLENYDKATTYADSVLEEIKGQIDKKIGSNYIGNSLYGDILFRWNNKQPISYYVSNNSDVTREYIDTIRRAFSLWAIASNGEISFKESAMPNDANIVVTLLKTLPTSNGFSNGKTSGMATPIIKDGTLQKVDVLLATYYPTGERFSVDGFRTLALHEIGHSLGIGGHSASHNDIMHYDGDSIYGVNPNKTFSKRDVNTLTLLYRMVPDVINTPISQTEYDNLFYHYIITTIPGEDFELEMQKLFADLNKNPNNIPAWVDLAINYGIRKQYERSNLYLNNILPLTQNNPHNQFVVLYNMATNSYKMKQYHDAEKYLHMAKMNHEDIDTKILDAFIDLKLKRKDIGKNKLINLNEEYPDNIEIALKLAEVYYFDRDRAKAKEVIDKLIANNSEAIRERRVLKYRAFNSKLASREKRK